MKPRIRIIYKQRKLSFGERLESRARALLKNSQFRSDPTAPIGALERRLALTVSQLEDTRSLHKELRRQLVRQECYADNELHDMEMRTPRYSPYRFPEREKLQRRLIKIEDERRRLAMVEHESVREIRDRLLELLDQQTFLSPTD